ncbi:ABC transporter permease [Streptomyces sp. NPDC013740]|uniref:ABC transporter permease n=1 Tax=Streptomyces sp. NPDC013740 TaxID=3364867 RepID=UPI0036F8A02B
MFRTALRNVLAHKARLLMTAFAVMLGVTFVAGSLVYGDSQNQAATARATDGYQRIAVNVAADTAPGGRPATLEARTVATLAGIDGVAAATGRVEGFAAVAGRDGTLLGQETHLGANFVPASDGTDPAYRFTEGSGPTGEGTIALDETTAALGGYHVGDTVRVGSDRGASSYTLSGVFRTDGTKLPAGGSLTLFNDATAQRLLLTPGHYHSIEITARPGADATALLEAVKSALPPGTSAVTGARLAQIKANVATSGSSTMSQILLGFAAVALFVATFLISNTFTMLIARRTRELALLRAVGATRKQVRRILLTESLLVGLASSVVGLAVGTGVAALLRKLSAPAAPLVLTPTTVIVSILVGTLLPALSAWLPIRRAMAIAPVAALGAAEPVPPARTGSLRTGLSAALVLTGVSTTVYGALSEGEDARTVIGLGALLALTGTIGLIPLLSRPYVASLRPLLTRLAPVHGHLAAGNTVRDPRRTGATAAALAIALTLASGLSVLGASAAQYLDRATTHDFVADYQIKPAGGGSLRLTPATATPLEKLPGAVVSPLDQSTEYRLAGRESVLTGVDPATIGRLLRYDVVAGSLDRLTAGQIAVADYKADAAGWRVGQTLPLERGGKNGSVTIGAIYHADPQSNLLPSITAPHSLVARYDATPYTAALLVSTDGGPTPAARARIVQALGDNPALAVHDQADIRSQDSRGIGDQLNVFYALLSMALVIAALGIANTLAMSVLERRKEIGTLRALGLDRAGVARMIRLEALLVGALGALLGTTMGVFLGWALGHTLQESVVGYELVVPWGRLALGVLIAMTGALLASVWPARNAARVDIPTATTSP